MKRQYERCADPSATAIVLVARPDRVALMEAARTSAELRGQGLTNQHLVINGCVPGDRYGRPACRRVRAPRRTGPRQDAASVRARFHGRISRCAGRTSSAWRRCEAFSPPRRRDCRRQLAPAARASRASWICGRSLTSWPRGARPRHGHGKGRRRQDHDCRRDRGRAGIERGKPVNLTTTDPAQHLLETLPESVPASQSQSYRSQGGSEALSGANAGRGEEHEVAGATLLAAGRAAIALLRGGRSVSGVLAGVSCQRAKS